VKKVVYGIVAASVVFAVQPAAADSTQFWNGERYQGVADLPFPQVSTGADLSRTVVAPGSAPQGRRNSRAATDGDGADATRARHDAAPVRQFN
jgi:hypothetical protein